MFGMIYKTVPNIKKALALISSPANCLQRKAEGRRRKAASAGGQKALSVQANMILLLSFYFLTFLKTFSLALIPN
jgi:hypothetical protein